MDICAEYKKAETQYLEVEEQLLLGITIGQENAGSANDEKDIESFDQEMVAIRQKLEVVKQKRNTIRQRREHLAHKLLQGRLLWDALREHVNEMTRVKTIGDEKLAYASATTLSKKVAYSRTRPLVTLNDVFFIWYLGPFGTINNFRLGTLPSKSVDFAEINAGLGQVALCIHLVAQNVGLKFQQFYISPLANASRVVKVDDKRTWYPLFMDAGAFSLFPKRNFNSGLSALVGCMVEVGEYIAKHDPTLALPHRMSVVDSKIADLSFVYGGEDGDEIWTRSLKYLLANLKWIITWHTKSLIV